MKNETRKLVVNDTPAADMEQQAECLIDGIGTNREWVACGYNDRDGFSEVAMLCHPSNAARFTQAINEYDALLEVAIAAKNHIAFKNGTYDLELALKALSTIQCKS